MLATHGHVCQSVSCVGMPIRLPDNPQPRSNYYSTRVEPKPGHVRTSACAQILRVPGPVHSPYHLLHHTCTHPLAHSPLHTHPNLTPRPHVPLGIGRGAAQGCSSLERKLPRVIGSARRVKLAHRDSSCLHHAVVRCDNIADPFALCASCLHALEPTTATTESTTTTAIMIAITAPAATTADAAITITNRRQNDNHLKQQTVVTSLPQPLLCHAHTQHHSHTTLAHTGASDTGCTPYRDCTTGQFESSTPTTTTDRVCRGATTCSSVLEYEVAPLTATTDRSCAALTRCVENVQYQASAPTATTVCCDVDVQSAPFLFALTHTPHTCPNLLLRPPPPPPSCFAMYALSAKRTRTRVIQPRTHARFALADARQLQSHSAQDRVCTNYTTSTCAVDQFQASARTSTSDRVCLDCTTCTAETQFAVVCDSSSPLLVFCSFVAHPGLRCLPMAVL
jgi:hypothetical protein